MSKLINILAFVAGAAVGSVVTWKIVKTNYEQRVQEEVDSVKKAFSKLKGERQENELSEPDVDSEDEEKHQYENIILDKGYAQEIIGNEPYIITAEDFGESDYETVSYTYYADGVLADDLTMCPISKEDIMKQIGDRPLRDLDEDPEIDVVYMRNDDTKTEYEILRDYRDYTEVKRLNS